MEGMTGVKVTSHLSLGGGCLFAYCVYSYGHLTDHLGDCLGDHVVNLSSLYWSP